MRLIDADALLKDIGEYHLSDGKFQYWVQIQPTIEAGPVVQCKDCVYSELWRPPLLWCRMFDHHTEEIGYCWKARRKEIENGTTNT